MADKPEAKQPDKPWKNPFLDTLSIAKWTPRPELFKDMDSKMRGKWDARGQDIYTK